MTKYHGCKRHKPITITTQDHVIRALMTAIDKQDKSITHIARYTGVDRGAVYRWAKGQAPRLDHVHALAEVLGYKLILVDKYSIDEEKDDA